MVASNTQKCNSNPSTDDITNQLYDTMFAMSGMDIDLDQSPLLGSVSDRDKVWDNHRNATHDVADIYNSSLDLGSYGDRMHSCSAWLHFGVDDGLKLKAANFCRVRNCPVCQWRKSLLWKGMMYKTYDKLTEQYPTHRWLFLTLTVSNPPITELRDTLNAMHKAWRNLMRRKEFGAIEGWIRTTEVTRDKQRPNTHAHPHYHVILFVKPSYFSKSYVKHADWVRIWGDCLGGLYAPNVDIRSVKPRKGDDNKLRGAIAETLKYAVKPSDMIGDRSPQAKEWFLEYTRQVHKLRFVASGGLLKNALKDGNAITDQDMITVGDEQDSKTDNRRFNFSYRQTRKGYVYNPKYNQS